MHIVAFFRSKYRLYVHHLLFSLGITLKAREAPRADKRVILADCVSALRKEPASENLPAYCIFKRKKKKKMPGSTQPYVVLINQMRTLMRSAVF